MPEPSPTEIFAINLRSARRRAGLSQEALGFACELHRTEISLLERGGREPRITTLVKLSDALGISPCKLLQGVGKIS